MDDLIGSLLGVSHCSGVAKLLLIITKYATSTKYKTTTSITILELQSRTPAFGPAMSG